MIFADGSIFPDSELNPILGYLEEEIAQTLSGPPLAADVVLDALDALRARVAPGALGASGTRVSGRPHGAGISSGASCARFAGDALRAHGSLLAPVAFWSGTAGIPFHALRPLRALIPFGPRRAPFTAGVAALVVAVILPAVT